MTSPLLVDLRARLASTSRRWRDDPRAFARDALGIELWWAQEEILRAVAAHHRVAVRSGHKVGKSVTAAVVALWWAYTRPDGRVVMTSAGARQVSQILWREIVRLVRGARPDVAFPKPAKTPDHGMQWEDGRQIVGFSTDAPEQMAGFSGANLLYIVDEASGVDERIFEAIEGNMAGGGRMLLTSNPTQTSGTFYNAFHRDKSLWRTIHVSSESTPNVTGKGPQIRGLATREWVEQKARQWGKDSPLYQVRVAGNFPTQGSNAVVPLSFVEAARARWEDTRGEGRLELGVDVARFGDDETVIAPRRGKKVYPLVVMHGADTSEIAGRIRAIVREMREPRERPLVKVDAGGGYGGGVVDQLRGDRELEVVEVNGASAARTDDDFMNLRAEMAFALADFLGDGGAIPDDDDLHEELVAPTYGFDPRGRRKVEAKDEIKKRLGRSPDRADAVGLAVWRDDVVHIVRPTATPTSRWGRAGRGFG